MYLLLLFICQINMLGHLLLWIGNLHEKHKVVDRKKNVLPILSNFNDSCDHASETNTNKRHVAAAPAGLRARTRNHLCPKSGKKMI